jgi:hypothetical protein
VESLEGVGMKERTFEINVEDHNGFLRVFMGRGEPAGELAKFLSATLANWMNAGRKQRCQEPDTPIAARNGS